MLTKKTWNLVAYTTLFASAALVGCSGDDTTPVERLPVYNVVASGTSAESAERLATALSLGKNSLAPSASMRRDDGSIRFHDAARFHKLPTKAIEPAAAQRTDEAGRQTVSPSVAVDMDALKALRPVAETDALARTKAAFA